MNKSIYLAILMLCFGTALGQSLRVRHDHDPWGSCEGELRIHASGIDFKSSKEAHNRQWSWNNIQTVDRFSPTRFTVLTYQDQKLLLGRDQPFDFRVLEGEGLADEIFDLILKNLPRPIVDRIEDDDVEIEYEIPVKHLHTLGGCEGILRFSEDRIIFVTDHQKDTRTWRKDQEVAGIWSIGRFDLQIQVYEKNSGDFYGTRNFRFQLKRPLDPEYYRSLRRELLLRF
jgi:hypothetical protein